MMDVSFGGMRGKLGGGEYPSLCPTFVLGGSKHHILGYGITFEG
jgi:hypothetical protein